MKRFRRWVTCVGIGLVVAAVLDQLRRPAAERTWEGEIGGVVPYDLRMPTMERARARWWNPQDDRVFVPQVFGVGWTVNLARLSPVASP